MQELLIFLAQFTDCFAGSYFSKGETIEILKKSEIDFLAIDINGSPRDVWWNVVQYISTNDLPSVQRLIDVSLEENPQSSCLTKLKQSNGTVKIDFGTRSIHPGDNLSHTKGVLSDTLNLGGLNLINKQKDIATTFSNSLAIGLIEHNEEKRYCTGFLLSAKLVMMPAHMISNLQEIKSLRFALNNPLQLYKTSYAFEEEPYLYDAENWTMVLQIKGSIDVPPLELAHKEALNNLKDKNVSLITYSNFNKKITTLTNVNYQEGMLVFDIATPIDSLGGPLIIDGKVIGMHCITNSNGKGKAVMLLNSSVKF